MELLELFLLLIATGIFFLFVWFMCRIDLMVGYSSSVISLACMLYLDMERLCFVLVGVVLMFTIICHCD